MSDDLPTDERLGRIARGVQRRIDRRRQVGRQIAGASVAVLLIAGGIALVRPTLAQSGSASGSSAREASAAAPAAGGTSAGRAMTVVCHGAAATRAVALPDGDLPAAAFAACAAALGQSAQSKRPNALDAGTPSPMPTPVLCRSSKGTLEVYLGDAAACAAHALRPFAG